MQSFYLFKNDPVVANRTTRILAFRNEQLYIS